MRRMLCTLHCDGDCLPRAVYVGLGYLASVTRAAAATEGWTYTSVDHRTGKQGPIPSFDLCPACSAKAKR